MGDKSNLQMDRQPIKLTADKNISDITVKLHPTIALYDFALHNFSEEIITWQTNARDINWKIMQWTFMASYELLIHANGA